MLPPAVLAMYPGVLSKAGGVTFVLLQRLRLWASKSRGFENLVDNYNESRSTRSPSACTTSSRPCTRAWCVARAAIVCVCGACVSAAASGAR
jgi:hypothetical protein